MAQKLGIDPDFYKNKDIHIHAPEGAVPKDGPSAGVTMMTALVSALTGKAVKRDVAMTGEITLRGKVLAIGGLKEKSMAAYRAGVKTVIIPDANKKDIPETDETVRRNITFIPVKTAEEVLLYALSDSDDTDKSKLIIGADIQKLYSDKELVRCTGAGTAE